MSNFFFSFSSMGSAKLLCQTSIPKLFVQTKVPLQSFNRSLSKTALLKNVAFKVSQSTAVASNFSLNFLRYNSENIKTHVCWKCGITIDPSFFCEKCNHLQKPNLKQNYFELFSIPVSFSVETKQLTKKYREILNNLHPDRFSTKKDDERLISEEYSSLVNKAYSTLLHPLDRGLYLLKLQGISIEEDSVTMDPETLMEIMEKNEELESANTEETISQLKTAILENIDELLRKTDTAFKKKNYQEMKQVLSKMKYYDSIVLKLKEKKQQLNIPN